MVNLKLLITIFVFLSAFITTSGNGIQERCENFIMESCGTDINFEFKKFIISAELKKDIEGKCEQKFFQDHIIYWEIGDDTELKYIAIIDNVYGKTLPITFLVIFNLDGSIHNSTIVKYREEHGGGVSSENWLSQFNGKNNTNSFDVGEDIQAISGATISVNSVSRGIKKITILFSEILGHNEYKTN
jgi:Na+-translocating ferredoxin:NAD+ oxidoreductase RnfG subunit